MSYLEIQRAQKLVEFKLKAASKGWIILTTIYNGSKSKLEIMCEKGHTFLILPQHLDRNKCSMCTGISPTAAAAKFYNIIKEKGGSVAPNSYVGSKEKVEITCDKGHIWKTNPSVINNGNWCPECGGRTSTAGAVKYYNILRKRNALGADPYIDSKTPVRIQCEHGHIWTTTPSNVNTDAHWCPVCADRSPIAAAESYYKVVSERGDIAIDKYINSETKLTIQCGKGHIFLGRPDHIKSGRWCPTCNESKGELTIANILTELNLPFERQAKLPELSKCSYDFLTYYNGKHVFIEFDGKQHFEQAPYHTKEEFESGRKRDIEKTKLVVERYKLTLIRIGYRVLENGSDIKSSLKQALDLPDRLIYIDHELYTWLTPHISLE